MNPHLNNLNHMTAPVAVPSCSAHNRPDNGRCLSSNGNEKENHQDKRMNEQFVNNDI